MFKLYFTLTQKLQFFLTAFAVILTPVALPIVPKVEFNFEVIMYITIFVSEVRKAALNLRSVVETYLKALRCFLGGCKKKNFFTRKFWGLSTPWSSILRPPEHWFVFFLSILKPKAVIYPCKEWKQDLGSFLDLAHNVPWLPALFKRAILQRKTVFLGPLKSSENMLTKSILIGLFVLKNNRTIGEPKNFKDLKNRKRNLNCREYIVWENPLLWKHDQL